MPYQLPADWKPVNADYGLGILDPIVEFGEVHELQLDCIILVECKMLMDFGPWKAGQHVDSLTLNLHTREVFNFDNDGNVTAQWKCCLIPAPVPIENVDVN